MRYFLLILLALTMTLTAGTTRAQAVTCDDGSRFTSQVEMTLPPIDDETFEFVVTALAITPVDPIVGVIAPDDFTYCNAFSDLASTYEISTPTSGAIVGDDFSAQEIVIDEGENRVRVGTANGRAGELLTVIEGEFLDLATRDHTYTLAITPAMIASGVQLSAYLFPLQDDFAPMMSVNGVSAQPVSDSLLITPFDSSAVAIRAPLPTNPGTATITVGRSVGRYALVLHLGTGTITAGDGQAVLGTTDDGRVTVSCDDRLLSQNGIRLLLPVGDDAWRVTALGAGDIDPLLVADATCYDDTPAALDYAVRLPTVGAEGTTDSAQVMPLGAQVTLASKDSVAGELVVIIEGGTLTAERPEDNITLDVSVGMLEAFSIADVYAIATDSDLDTVLTVNTPTGTYQCDDAGTTRCEPNTPALDGAEIVLDAQTLATFAQDSLVQVEIDDITFPDATFANIIVRASGDTSGDYVLVLHLVTE